MGAAHSMSGSEASTTSHRFPLRNLKHLIQSELQTLWLCWCLSVLLLTVVNADVCRLPRLLPALSVPARSGKLPRDGGALAAPQTSHDGGGGQSGTPGCITLCLLNKGGGGTSHDAAGSGGAGGGDLREDADAVWLIVSVTFPTICFSSISNYERFLLLLSRNIKLNIVGFQSVDQIKQAICMNNIYILEV